MSPHQFLRLFYTPTQVLRQQRDKASLPVAMINLFLTGANAGVVGILYVTLLLDSFGTHPPGKALEQIGGYILGEGFHVLLYLPFISAVGAVIFLTLFMALVWMIATQLGGHGRWVVNVYLLSILFLPIAIGTFLVNLALIFPLVGGLLAVGWGIYILYLVIQTVSIANGISPSKSILALVFPVALAVGLIRTFTG
ncbi:MAG: hypothetical protein Q8P05_04350 [Candidatus Diapherotrites archaeon]|nr:hypothetical protein [Candidatus Diapherotrites archaeon]MDZ4256909.1 hypothetical protein [archaeon]